MMTVGSPSEDALLSQRGAEAAGEVAQPVGVANLTLRYVNRKNVAILALVCLLTFGVYFCYDLPAALFSHFKALAGGSSTAYEVLYSVYSLPNTVLPIAGGALSDGWLGPHRCVTVACTLVAAGSALVALGCGTGSFPLAVSGRFVMGLGGETVFGLQQTLCSFWFPVDLQPLAMSITLTMGNLGEVLNFIATKRIEQLVGFANTCWLAVVPCVLSMGAGVWLGVLSQDRQFCRSIRCESASVPRSSSSSSSPPPPPPPLPSTRPSMATIPPSPSYTEEVAATWSPLVRDGGDIGEEEALQCVSEAVLARRHLHTEKAHQAAPGLEQARISPSQADNSGGSLLYHSMDGREDAAASADGGDDRAHSDGVDRGAWKKTSQGGWRRQAFSAVCTAETVPLYLVNMGCMGNYFIFPSMASDVLSDAWPGSTGAERSSLLALYFAIPMVLSPIAGVALGREGGASTSKPSVLAAWLTAGCAANAAGFALLSWAAAAGGGGGGSTSLLHRAGPAPGIVLVAAATAVVGATLTPCLALVVDGTFHGTAFGIWSGTQNLALAALALGVGAIADARSPNAAVAFLALCGAASTASAAVLWAIATRERPKRLLNGNRLRVATEVSY